MSRIVVTRLLTLSGTALLLHGLYLPLKAEIAQKLLRSTWSEALASAGEHPAKPWPWADTHAVARLATPYGDDIVLAGSHGEALAFGPGLDPRGAPPGQPGNVVLAGHRDTHFAQLEHLRLGDVVELETRSGRARFVVSAAYATTKFDTGPLAQSSARNELTLITCYPFGRAAARGPLRWIVRAVEVETDLS